MAEIKSVKDLRRCVASLCRDYIDHQENHAHLHRARLGYSQYNDIIGALESAKLEFFLKMVAPGEDVEWE
jgi:hypothetical protein